MYQAITRYYYVPLVYKSVLKLQIEEWLASSPTAWVVVTPAKYDGAEVILDLLSGINDMQGNPIYEMKQGLGNLLGFCLKGELDEATHFFALSLNGVLAFDKAQDYIDFIETI